MADVHIQYNLPIKPNLCPYLEVATSSTQKQIHIMPVLIQSDMHSNFCNKLYTPRVQSTSLAPSLLRSHNTLFHLPTFLTDQSQQSDSKHQRKTRAIDATVELQPVVASPPTLQLSSLLTRMFLAAKSLWTNPLLDRYLIPSAISWQKVSSCFGRPSATMVPGLERK